MKPSKTFKLAKSTKRMMALMNFTDSDQRVAFKHMMIEAQLMADVKPVKEKK